jgi:hypothetical protein
VERLLNQRNAEMVEGQGGATLHKYGALRLLRGDEGASGEGIRSVHMFAKFNAKERRGAHPFLLAARLAVMGIERWSVRDIGERANGAWASRLRMGSADEKALKAGAGRADDADRDDCGRGEESRMSSNVRLGEGRRSHRVHLAVQIIVRGKRGDQPFQEDTTTTVVNASGGLFLSPLPLQMGQPLTVVNKKTTEELACKVAFVSAGEANKMQVGFEFLEPAPKFWRIAFPPDNWDSSERKRPGEAPRVAPNLAPATTLPGRK